MLSRRSFLRSSAASAAYLGSGVSAAWAANAPGVTDTEIKIGQTMPYSGPASAYGVYGRTEAAYFRMINEMGGSTAERSISSASTIATARQRPSNKLAI